MTGIFSCLAHERDLSLAAAYALDRELSVIFSEERPAMNMRLHGIMTKYEREMPRSYNCFSLSPLGAACRQNGGRKKKSAAPKGGFFSRRRK